MGLSFSSTFGKSGDFLTDDRVVPIGTIVAWAKNLSGLTDKDLPDGWYECNGQTVDTIVLPNLNGAGINGRFLGGASTSGATGGAVDHTHTVVLPTRPDQTGAGVAWFASPTNMRQTQGATPADAHFPPYYRVVWIMKVT